MKSLTKHIKQSLNDNSISESLNKIGIYESLRIGINDNPYQYHPTTWDELIQIIRGRYKELGPGTKQNPIDFNDIDVSKIDTFCNELTNYGLFENKNFEYIDISNWDVSNIKNMDYMFFNCKKLKSVGDLSNWDISNVETMNHMFADSGIKKSNIPDWYKG